MAYTFEDEEGFLGHGPSINGRRELEAFFAKQSKRNYPALVMLLTHGCTHLVHALGVECRALAKKATDAKLDDVASTLTSLATDSARAKGAVIMAA